MVEIVARKAKVDVNNQLAQIDIVRQGGSYEDYTGAYNFTPTQQTQIIECNNMHMTANVIIAPIPQNYGLITYNGFSLTVS